MSVESVRVAAVLADRPEYGEAVKRMREWIAEAGGRGAQAVCFPEYYFDWTPDGRGVRLDGPLVEEIIGLCREHSTAVAIGLTEAVDSRRDPRITDYYNSAVFIDGGGVRGVQRKVFLWVDPEWDQDRVKESNSGTPDYRYPPLMDERRRFLPGWDFFSFAFAGFDRVAALICADALMGPAWSRVIPQGPEVIFNLNSRLNITRRWGPDLEYMCRRYGVPVVASNNWDGGEAAVFDSDGECVARISGRAGLAVADVIPAAPQEEYKPIRLRHWDGEPDEQLGRLYRY